MAESTGPTTTATDLYHPLDADQHELRLLKICPSKDSDSPIQVKIFACRFEHVRGQFIPLSYVWGDPADTETVIVNGIPKEIPKNLVLFLQQVQALLPNILAEISWEKPALFWADALCINQDDKEERNHQVQFMRSIYGSAPVVLSWLGQAKDSHLATGLIEACVAWLDACEETDPEWTVSWDPNCGGWMERHAEFWSFSGHGKKKNPYWEALGTLLDSPYWMRTWIFQEITLPADALLIYGSTLTRLSSLKAVVLWIARFICKVASDFPFLDQASCYALLLTVRFTAISVASSIKIQATTRERLAVQQRPTLVLVPELATLCASDPRDKIFGLLGVMDTQLVADYNKSVVQVYCEFVSAWMREMRNLNFLLHACRMPQKGASTGQPGLPSWAPDWAAISCALNARHDVVEVLPIGHFFLQRNLRASAGLLTGPAYISQSCRILTTTGLVCDEVDEVYSAWKGPKGSFAIGTGFFNFIKRHMHRSTLGGRDHSRRHIFQVLFRTALHDSSLTNISVRLVHSDAAKFQTWAICFLLCLARSYMHSCDPLELLSDGLAAAFLSRLDIPHGPEFSRFWREEIFGDVKLEGPDMAHWEDAAEALQWAWENHRTELETIQLQLTSTLAHGVKFLTKDNYMGVASSAKVGDKVVVLAGCDAPVLLRPKDGHYEHIGPCFVIGLMDGEAKDMVDRGEAKLEKFDIR